LPENDVEDSTRPVTRIKLLASYRIYRQLSEWIPPPLVFRSLGPHCHDQTFGFRCHTDIERFYRPQKSLRAKSNFVRKIWALRVGAQDRDVESLLQEMGAPGRGASP
jgi:hypothetical protein